MDATFLDSQDDSVSRPEAKQVAIVRSPHAFVFGANCPSLAAWGASIGFNVVVLGVSADPFAAIRALCAIDHGRGGMTMGEILPAAEAWDDWVLEPIATRGGALPNVEPWGGVLRVELPSGDTPEAFGGRFAAALVPLDATRHALAARPVRTRWAQGGMPPAMPRFTLTGDGWAAARSIYRWSGAQDSAYVARAILAASAPMRLDQAMLDLLADGEDRLVLPDGLL